MKVKTYFSTIAFLIFFPPTEFFLKKLVYIRIRLILVVTKNLKKIHRPQAEILAHKVGKFQKSHGRLDPTLRMHEGVHARSVEFLRVRNDRLPSGRILCEKEIVFLLIILRVTR